MVIVSPYSIGRPQIKNTLKSKSASLCRKFQGRAQGSQTLDGMGHRANNLHQQTE